MASRTDIAITFSGALMKPHLTVLAVFSSLAIIAVPSSAQTMKPGLWEINNKIHSDNSDFGRMMAQMQKQMASMPPEQRKAMEDMMQKKAGVGMPVMKGGGMVVKMCISKEMVAQGQLPMQQQGNCTHQRANTSSSSIKMSFTCTNPASSGEGEFKLIGDSAYTMKMKMTSSMTGRQEVTSMDASGKWLGADCDNIKPIPIPTGAK